MPPGLLELGQKLTEVIEEKNYLDVYGVRITPAFLEFNNTFEGRTYKQKITIQNISKSLVTVTVIQPTSFAYKLRCVKNHNISPGLTFAREIAYIHSHTNAPSCIMGIYINQNRLDYRLVANASAPNIILTPRSLDFGFVDAGVTSKTQILHIKNNGSQPTRFYIDDTAATTRQKLIINPNKGFLHPKTSAKITIKLICSEEGPIHDPIWVKCDKPYIVTTSGSVISPKFEPVHRSLSTTFSLIDFPVTYMGVTNTKTVYVRNYSSCGAMFCLMGEVDGKIMDLKTCQAIADDFKHFDVTPKDGICESKEVKIFQFKFSPQKPKLNDKTKPFYFCIYHICRIRCKYLTPYLYEGDVFINHGSFTRQHSQTWSASITFEQSREMDMQLLLSSSNDILSEGVESKQECDCVKFVLHGIVETPSVTVVPDELSILNLETGRKEVRVLELTNHSNKLPIIIVYKKVPYVMIERSNIALDPASSIQISIFITPQKLGVVKSQIEFDLAYYDQPRTSADYKVIGKIIVPLTFEVKSVKSLHLPQINMGITPNYINEVGKFCDNIRFSTPMQNLVTLVDRSVLRKPSSAMIAFPNDMQRSLRPWRDKPKIKTIFARLPRYIAPIDPDYELTALEKDFKKGMANYYSSYICQRAAKSQLARGTSLKAPSEYDIKDQHKVMLGNTFARKFSCQRTMENSEEDFFIPLTPMEMNNITISPLVVYTNPIAAHSRYEFEVKISNSNTFPIRIFIRPESSNIFFMESNRRTIKGGSSVNIPVVFVSSSVGYYSTSMDFIVNECGVFVVTVIAEICPIILHLSAEVIEFTDDKAYSFIEITNPLNICTRFSWQLQSNNFEIYPSEGAVDSKRTLMCHVKHLLNRDGPLFTEAELVSGDRILSQLKLIVKPRNTTLRFMEPKVTFHNMPLNIPVNRRVVLVNDSKSAKTFSLRESHFSPYIEVLPREGTVNENSFKVITISLTLKACVTFSTVLKFHIVRSGILELPISGNVVFPDIIVTPSIIKFQKIPASTLEVLRFTVENNSKAMASVKFDMSMYNEYKITECRNHWDSQSVNEVVLEKHSVKQLFIHYLPIAAASDKFVLPLIINDILGPVVNESQAKKVAYFISNDIVDSKGINIPMSLPVSKVQSYSTEPRLCFSKFKIYLNFKYQPFRCNNNYELRVSNCQKDPDDFCIRTEDLGEFFSITYLRGKKISRYPQAIMCSLDWKEEVVFNISFQPIDAGTYRAALPVYLKSDRSMQPHNTLYIEGKFECPTITVVNPFIYYKPVPLHVNIVTAKKFIFENHYENCSVQTYSDFREQRMEVIDGRPDGNNRREVELKLFFYHEKSRHIACNLSIVCTCGIRCDVPLYGVCENCFLTTYALVSTYIGNSNYNLQLNKKESFDTLNRPSFMSILDAPRKLNEEFDLSNFYVNYPFFPSDSNGEDDDEFAEFMAICVSVAENWVYTQGFFGRSFYEMPEGINFIIFESASANSPKSKLDTSNMPPFIQLLCNLAGKQFEMYLEMKPLPDDEVNRVAYIYELYTKALEFLSGMGAYFTYVCPEFMLDYQMYCTYMQNFSSDSHAKVQISIADGHAFYKIAKQCWLDVILQTYKVLILSRLIVGQKGIVSPAKAKSTPEENFRSSVKNVIKNNHLFSTTELLLLNWLEFHYNEVKTTIWMDNPFLDNKEIAFFGESFSDGFVYIAITLTYCPYLQSHFKELYPDPINYAETLHNNIKVIESWNILNFSLDVTVQDLVKPHSLRTLFIIVYLYEVLPSMYPSETLEFTVGLSQRIKKTLIIKNVNDFTVAYKSILYQNDEACFTTDHDFYVIQPKGKCKIEITFWAKFIKKNQCTLILSGECKGYYYAKTTVVTLIGTPDMTLATDTIYVPLQIYKSQEITLSCRSPYKIKSTHQIQLTTLTCTTLDEVNSLPLRKDYPKLFLTRLHPIRSEIDFDDDGVGNMDCIVTTLSKRKVPILIYCRNSKVGDFSIKVITDCKLLNNIELLLVSVPRNTMKSHLPNRDVEVTLEIPCQNNSYWNTIVKGYLKTCTTDEEFWKRHIRSTTGMHILQKLITISLPGYSVKFCGPIEYKIRMHKNSKVKLPDSIYIEDECSSDTIKVPMHLRNIDTLPHDVFIELECVNGFYLRNYRIHFISDSSDSESESLRSKHLSELRP